MRTQQAIELLQQAIKAKLNVLLVGAPGIGKTEMQALAAQYAKALNYVMHPSIGDPTDAKGAPWIFQSGDSVRARFVPFAELQEVYDAVEQGLLVALFLDDLGQATGATQASYMSLMDKLKGRCSIIAATNRRTDRAGVSGLLEPVKSRFTTIIEIEAHSDDWCTWAVEHEINPVEIAYIHDTPDALHEFTATQDLVNQPCPRTWAAVSRILSLALPDAVMMQAINGAVGQGRGGEFFAYWQTYKSLTSADDVLLDPKGANIPTKPSMLYALSRALAFRANAQNFDSVVTFVERLHKAHQSEFGVLILRDCVKRDKALAKTQTFITRVASTELGALIRGE